MVLIEELAKAARVYHHDLCHRKNEAFNFGS